MTNKERVLRALKKEKVDFIPFTIYENHLPRTTWERELRNEGLCIVERRYSVFKTIMPDVKVYRINYTENDVEYLKTIYQTPVGELTCLQRREKNTYWYVEHIFKTPDDYKKILFIIKNTQYKENYENFINAEKKLGDDFILRGGVSLTPLHEIMVHMMGIEKFSEEWIERRDEIEKIYYAKVEKLRELYPILADSPCFHFNFGGNETGDVMGRERFEKYVLPLYFECAEILHKKGKILGAHLDGKNKIWADLIAKSPLDYIEAFSPYPDTDMTFEEAVNIWKEKILWINFPSSCQFKSEREIEEIVFNFIGTSKPQYNLIIGITEDIAETEEEKVLKTIMRSVKKYKIN